MRKLLLPSSLARQIEREGAAAYPDECCGIIYGGDGPQRRVVQRLEAVPNAFDERERFHRFSISPQQLMRAEKQAGDRGELVLGFYHSHPDHPARPSEYDRQHAWPFYSYVIVSIGRGEPLDMTSWRLDEAAERFEREEIEEL